MSDLSTAPDPFDIDGIHLTPSGDGSTVFYLPAAPSPERGAGGKPTLAIFKTPQVTTLQLGTQFGLTAEELSALATKIAAQVPTLANANLQPAPLQVQKAAVLLADHTGAPSEIATSSTSAFPPYAAVFNAKLQAAQAAQAISAAGGRRGVLFVDYTIVAQDGAPTVRRTDVAGWFFGTDGLSHVHVYG
jgi:hypothetical protein